MDLKSKLAGKFIVFDGPDGSGKGTQLRMLAERLSGEGLEVVCARDPGGTTIGDRIRSVLLDYDLSEMDVRCETFLFMASRAQLVGEVVEPALAAGKVVLCDRFVSSTYAYQGAAGYDVSRLIELGRLAVGETWPNLTLIIDVPTEEGFRRTGRKPHHAGRNRKSSEGQGLLLSDVRTDAMEARPIAFHRKVRERFRQLPPDYPGKVVVLDGLRPPQQVHEHIVEIITSEDF
ncbi:MAG TPA: dTMP kinase [Phycisphaerae bacterium]|nr:dTMP kinase [Phycisphaerae bacterium]HOJ52950.1 dTMP kinase [Phycisphaerae bacterium]HOL24687.1 dTMP kinase [Phycisphaerae bacterium]HPP19223.1 dTMP kinase [Phycisphaerae bacterium]HPU31390.1 dTMP kinase [Phycisphaerae bacterium]